VEDDCAEGDNSSEAVFFSDWTKSGAFSRRCLRAEDRRFGIFTVLYTLVGKDALCFQLPSFLFLRSNLQCRDDRKAASAALYDRRSSLSLSLSLRMHYFKGGIYR
jgi:hypothetical protein